MLVQAPSDGTAIRQVSLSGEGANATVENAIYLSLATKNNTDATINGTSLNSGDNDSVTLIESETDTLTLDNQTVTLTAVLLETGADGTVTLDVRYPSDFTWSEQSKALSNQLPLIVAITAGLMVFALIGGAVRS
jgi:hypothetical protein